MKVESSIPEEVDIFKEIHETILVRNDEKVVCIVGSRARVMRSLV